MRSEGLTYKQISHRLNDQGITTTRNKTFTPSSVHSLEKKMDIRINRTTRVFPTKISDMRIEFEDLIIHKRKNKIEKEVVWEK